MDSQKCGYIVKIVKNLRISKPMINKEMALEGLMRREAGE